MTVHNVSANKINLNANDTQLTIEDKTSVIAGILTDKVCQVVLEDGTSDTIPCSEDKIKVTGSGKLTQVNMKAAEDLILTQLSPKGGLLTTMKEDESIDYTGLEVIGTYMESGAVTVYTAKLTYNLESTFTRLEKDFSIKIDEKTTAQLEDGETSHYETAYQRVNGKADEIVYDWTKLAPGYHLAFIDSDFVGAKGEEYRHSFRIAVTDKNVTYQLVDLSVDTTNLSINTYLSGETLDLTGLVVVGKYHSSAVTVGASDYTSPLFEADYTVSPSAGEELINNGEDEKKIKVTVSANGCSAEFEVTVKPSCYVTFNYGYKQEIVRIGKNTKIEKPEPARDGYEFIGWYNKERTELFDFNINIGENMLLHAKWSKKKPFDGAIVYADATTADKANDAFIFVKDPIQDKTPIGIVFYSNTQVAKIVHLKQLKVDDGIEWCTTSAEAYNKNTTNVDTIATSLEDGSGNWQVICGIVNDWNDAGKYPAFEYVNGLANDVSTDHQSWYLPAKDELNFLTDSKVKKSLETLNCDCDYFEGYAYWSSSFHSYNWRGNGYAWSHEYGKTVYVTERSSIDMLLKTLNGKKLTARAVRKCYYQSSTTGDNLYNYE